MNVFKAKEKAAGRIVELKTDEIQPNPYQPRRYFDEKELLCLAQSIAENGLLQPITVRKTGDSYELISGERRLRAAKLAGLAVIPAIVTEKTDEESATLAIIENIQRSDLNFFEEAAAIEKLITLCGLTQEQAAKRLGKAQSTVANKLRILTLSADTARMVLKCGLNERQARSLLRLPEEMRNEAALTMYKKRMNTVQSDEYIERLLKPAKPPKHKWVFSEKRLYINNINRTIDTMKRSGVDFTSTKRLDNGYIEYVIRIAADNKPQ